MPYSCAGTLNECFYYKCFVRVNQRCRCCRIRQTLASRYIVSCIKLEGLIKLRTLKLQERSPHTTFEIIRRPRLPASVIVNIAVPPHCARDDTNCTIQAECAERVSHAGAKRHRADNHPLGIALQYSRDAPRDVPSPESLDLTKPLFLSRAGRALLHPQSNFADLIPITLPSLKNKSSRLEFQPARRVAPWHPL